MNYTLIFIYIISVLFFTSCVNPETDLQNNKIIDLKEKDNYLNSKIEDQNQKIKELNEKIESMKDEIKDLNTRLEQSNKPSKIKV
ncbi:coiled-coil domain-containing protein [Adhaeribacter radiodurans]|uniref:Uncharacterized protein n=1 Tax=Adhaeribacter radiodurans TaxID=2745197 RepID=A0A7L7L7N6_9BACT|nr:hypothetical protein [Adhaeribacter radiodurans]QMU28836.1 hypothetical protein HUW48_12660 [Adhaeribacter radiodurans]